MISLEMFLFGLMVSSVVTGLVTEAVKAVLLEYNVTYYANTLAGIVSVVVSAAVGIAYMILENITLNGPVVVCFVALIVMSWLCAMIGYDKVIQAISQFKTSRKD